jgi:hypothetical protein
MIMEVENKSQTGLYHKGGKEVPDWAVSLRRKRSPRLVCLACIIEGEKMSQTGLYHRGGIAVPEVVYQAGGEVVLEGTEHGREKYRCEIQLMETEKLS